MRIFLVLVVLFWSSVCLANGEVRSKRLIDLFDNRCVFDSTCRSAEYCDRDFPNPFGRCKPGLLEGAKCFMDRYCASKRCSYFSCEKRIQVANGPCSISADCPDNQYCDDIPGRDDLRQCFDRKCIGSCSKDSQCLSDQCHLFTCVKGPNC